jgi:glutamine amidotransferase
MKLTIINYGAGNVFSVKAAFQRLGIEPLLSNDIVEIQSSDLVIFPGVGHAEAAMIQLKESKLDLIIPALKQPVLGVCLGMQLMCESTEEGDVQGLNIFNDVRVMKFDDNLKVPHMGWNEIGETKGILSGLIEPVYFIHSYFAPVNEFTIAQTLYPIAFSAAMEKDNFIGCQFHPEKSGEIGEKILTRFLSLKK